MKATNRALRSRSSISRARSEIRAAALSSRLYLCPALWPLTSLTFSRTLLSGSYACPFTPSPHHGAANGRIHNTTQPKRITLSTHKTKQCPNIMPHDHLAMDGSSHAMRQLRLAPSTALAAGTQKCRTSEVIRKVQTVLGGALAISVPVLEPTLTGEKRGWKIGRAWALLLRAQTATKTATVATTARTMIITSLESVAFSSLE